MKIPIFFARRFVAGQTAAEAIKVVQNLNDDGIKASLDLLGENVKTLEDADQAILQYKDLFKQMALAKVDSGVSIKLTQLGLDFGFEACLEKTKQVLELAKENNIFVRIDMEGSKYTQVTIDVFVELRKQFDRLGLVLQSYLHRSLGDIDKMVSLKASIRVCKGAYKESSKIAYQSMDEIRDSYKKMVTSLLDAGCAVGIATHDDVLIDWAKDWVTQHNIDPQLFEFQMLYGLRMAKAKELVRDGYRVRSYVPFGEHWFPYFYRRLRERKENIFFVLKSLIKG